jgi:hypothetical protein
VHIFRIFFSFFLGLAGWFLDGLRGGLWVVGVIQGGSCSWSWVMGYVKEGI